MRIYQSNNQSITGHVHSVRSQDNHLLAKPSVYTSIGCRTFSYAAPQN